MGSFESMFYAASQTMRPTLMAALSAAIGLVPAAISTGIGSQVQRPLATVVVGGLFIGPLILLIVVPPLLVYFKKGKDREFGNFKRDGQVAEAESIATPESREQEVQ
jgi:Cu/Ag efflux pump CusA